MRSKCPLERDGDMLVSLFSAPVSLWSSRPQPAELFQPRAPMGVHRQRRASAR